MTRELVFQDRCLTSAAGRRTWCDQRTCIPAQVFDFGVYSSKTFDVSKAVLGTELLRAAPILRALQVVPHCRLNDIPLQSAVIRLLESKPYLGRAGHRDKDRMTWLPCMLHVVIVFVSCVMPHNSGGLVGALHMICQDIARDVSGAIRDIMNHTRRIKQNSEKWFQCVRRLSEAQREELVGLLDVFKNVQWFTPDHLPPSAQLDSHSPRAATPKHEAEGTPKVADSRTTAPTVDAVTLTPAESTKAVEMAQHTGLTSKNKSLGKKDSDVSVDSTGWPRELKALAATPVTVPDTMCDPDGWPLILQQVPASSGESVEAGKDALLRNQALRAEVLPSARGALKKRTLAFRAQPVCKRPSSSSSLPHGPVLDQGEKSKYSQKLGNIKIVTATLKTYILADFHQDEGMKHVLTIDVKQCNVHADLVWELFHLAADGDLDKQQLNDEKSRRLADMKKSCT